LKGKKQGATWTAPSFWHVAQVVGGMQFICPEFLWFMFSADDSLLNREFLGYF